MVVRGTCQSRKPLINRRKNRSWKKFLDLVLVFGLAKARNAGIVRLWGLDPKKVELAFGRQCWDEYADTVEGMIELLEKAVNELLERNKLIQGKARKIAPSPEMPLNVIIIDELAYLSAGVDKKTRSMCSSSSHHFMVGPSNRIRCGRVLTRRT